LFKLESSAHNFVFGPQVHQI